MFVPPLQINKLERERERDMKVAEKYGEMAPVTMVIFTQCPM